MEHKVLFILCLLHVLISLEIDPQNIAFEESVILNGLRVNLVGKLTVFLEANHAQAGSHNQMYMTSYAPTRRNHKTNSISLPSIWANNLI